MEERLQKFLAEAGIASRRKSEELIAAGRVQVNGQVVRELGVKIDPAKDKVLFDNKPVKAQETKKVYIMLHKPEGYVTTAKEQFGRPAVLDLVQGVKERIFPVGRLDYDTSGLLLLTNDGDLTYKLTHPKHDVDKTYIAKLYGVPDEGALQKFRRGVVIDGRKTRPAKIQILEKEKDMRFCTAEIIIHEGKNRQVRKMCEAIKHPVAQLKRVAAKIQILEKEKDMRFCTAEIIIHEGKNRQVRKMCEAIKHPVAQLKRVATGELTLGDLPKGKYRYLTEREIKYLKKL